MSTQGRGASSQGVASLRYHRPSTSIKSFWRIFPSSNVRVKGLPAAASTIAETSWMVMPSSTSSIAARIRAAGEACTRIGNISPKPSLLEGHRSVQIVVHGRPRQHKPLGFDRKQAPKSSKSAPRRSWPDRPSAWHPRLIKQPPAVAAPGMPARDRRALAASPGEAPPLVSAWADHTSDIRTRPPRTPS